MVESAKRITPGIRQDDDKGYGYEGEKCLLSGIEQADVREREGMRGDGSLRRRQWQRPLPMMATGAEGHWQHALPAYFFTGVMVRRTT